MDVVTGIVNSKGHFILTKVGGGGGIIIILTGKVGGTPPAPLSFAYIGIQEMLFICTAFSLTSPPLDLRLFAFSPLQLYVIESWLLC